MVKERWDEAAISRKVVNEGPLHVRSKCIIQLSIICESKAVMDLDPTALKIFKKYHSEFYANVFVTVKYFFF
jgi:hypothetical protein